MKTTLQYLTISAITLSTYLLIALLIALLFSSCQPDDMNNIAPVSSRPVDISGEWASPIATIPPTTVEEETLDGAKRWVIEFDDIDYDQHYKYQRFFSTVDGSFHNITELMTYTDATANADIDFLVGRVQNAAGFLSPHPQYVAHTQFKPTDLSAKSLYLMSQNNPEQLTDTFESSPYAATDQQPYNYVEDDYTFDYYQTGDIFLFKTDRNPARYGYVRIMRSFPAMYTSDRIVEVVVQTGRSNFVKLIN
ncbi:MAG: hypothetical protein WBA23_21520 [Tunicatimonas sp.]|uniref:hypothetical protein n=1 Tax=Tunicatimonas sp. TaxID=1940096 RepID=UPI003C749783